MDAEPDVHADIDVHLDAAVNAGMGVGRMRHVFPAYVSAVAMSGLPSPGKPMQTSISTSPIRTQTESTTPIVRHRTAVD